MKADCKLNGSTTPRDLNLRPPPRPPLRAKYWSTLPYEVQTLQNYVYLCLNILGEQWELFCLKTMLIGEGA